MLRGLFITCYNRKLSFLYTILALNSWSPMVKLRFQRSQLCHFLLSEWELGSLPVTGVYKKMFVMMKVGLATCFIGKTNGQAALSSIYLSASLYKLPMHGESKTKCSTFQMKLFRVYKDKFTLQLGQIAYY